MGAQSIKAARCLAGLYLRLSRDDEESRESASIANQRSLLTAYAKEHQYTIYDEYVDDGYSGTNFNRPGFQRMIQDIEDQKINLVLVKDLSRLGREYIQTGNYTEVYFPSKKVRFIAVNDGFDSESPYTDIAPFKHVVNEMYARDTSKKIRSAMYTKMRNGEYIGNFAPYGYRKSPEDKNRLIPDGESAAVVRKIFALASEGVRPAEIVRYLNGAGILSPALYRCRRHPGLNPDSYTKRGEWTVGNLYKLLRNIVYLGHTAQGKTTKVSFKSKTTLRNDPEDWIIVRNTHEPLVGVATFELVQKRLQGRAVERKGQFYNMFSGLAKCADCGRNMSTVGTRKKGSVCNLACGGYKLYGRSECSNHFIDYAAFYAIVLDAVREQACLTCEERDRLYRELCGQIRADMRDRSKDSQLSQFREQERKISRVIEQLYDDNLQGKVSPGHFYALLQKYEKQDADIKQRIAGLDAKEDEQEKQSCRAAFDRLAKLLERYGDIQELTPHLLFELVDRIEVGQGWYEKTGHGRVKHQEIKIHFRFLTQPQTKEYTV